MTTPALGLTIAPDALRQRLPRPHLPAHPGWEKLYWRAWELGARMVRRGTTANGFAPLYVDAAFGGNIFQWDTCFIAGFARYSDELLPILPALDNFYGRQEPDGYIAREYRWENGANLWAKASGDSVNPPLYAWAEWLVYQIHGRRERLAHAWPHLERYYRWLQANRRLSNGLYWITDMGSGMDNTPRFAAAWADYSMQQALNALSMARIARELGDLSGARLYAGEHADLAARINRLMWDDEAGFYWDLDAGDLFCKSPTIAPFWALLAEVAPPDRADRLVAHLRNPALFWRTHPFPTVPASHPAYQPAGAYWLGAVWAPTNYMLISGLRRCGYDDLATEATARHLDQLLAVLESTGTIWENYRADEPRPGEPARPDFVGWTGLGPIALLIEQIVGVEVDAPQHALRWRLREPGEHGIDNLPFGGGRVDLRYDGRGAVRVRSDSPLRLVVFGRHSAAIDVPAGGGSFQLE